MKTLQNVFVVYKIRAVRIEPKTHKLRTIKNLHTLKEAGEFLKSHQNRKYLIEETMVSYKRGTKGDEVLD